MLVSPKNFTSPPYKIPNQQDFAGGLVSFKDWLEAEEVKILKSILGIELYYEFIEALAESGELDQKWARLRDGSTEDDHFTYEYADVQYEYLGLVDLLVPEIYATWLVMNHRKNTSSGVIIPKGQQNTELQDPTFEVVSRHNEHVAKVGGPCKQDNSLYGFMIANESDYESWVFTEPTKKNQLDL